MELSPVPPINENSLRFFFLEPGDPDRCSATRVLRAGRGWEDLSPAIVLSCMVVAGTIHGGKKKFRFTGIDILLKVLSTGDLGRG